jgi:hypothetical protein
MARSVKVGDIVKDDITGFEGVAVGISEWLNQCRRICVQSQQLSSDGIPTEPQWFDEPQVKIVTAAAKPKKQPALTGGPQKNPTRKGIRG